MTNTRHDDELLHYGVLGMKWGVRRAKAKEARVEKKWMNRVSRNVYRIHDDAAAVMNARLAPALNAKPKYKNVDLTKNSALAKQYYKEYAGLLEKSLNDASKKRLGSSPTGRELKYNVNKDLDVEFYLTEAAHASDRPISFIGRTNDLGHITVLEIIEEETLEQSSLFINDYLEHFGVRGMKWGVRKTNDSASVSNDSRIASVTQEKINKSGVRSVSNDDLQRLVTRLNLERQYSSIKPKSGTERALSFIGNTLVTVGKQSITGFVGKTVTKQIDGLIRKAG